MFRLILALGGLIVIVLFTALIAPYFIDWTVYKRDFEREAGKVIGQPVHVAGEASLRLLPLPSLTFTDLSVGEYPDGKPMMTIEAFSLDVELMPFLSGEVRIVDMRLVRPDAHVVVGEGGTVAWTARQEMVVNPDRIAVENLSVVNGRITVSGLAGGRTFEAADINATISAQSLPGPWRIDARATVEGAASRIEITTGRMQDNGAIRVKSEVQRGGQPYKLVVDGPLAVKDGVLNWKGQFELTPSRASVEVADVARGEALPVRATGTFEATPTAIAATEFKLDIGQREDPYTISGSGNLDIRDEVTFAVTAAGRQIDIDTVGEEEVRTAASMTLQRRLERLQAVLDQVPIPQVNGIIDFSLPAVVAGDTTVREVSARIRPDGSGWKIENGTALLPGNTLVEANGRLGTGGDFGYSGKMLLASRQPTGFAAWLSGGNNEALRGLSNAGFSAFVTLTGNQATFDDLELLLDDARLAGKVQRLSSGSGRPGIIAELSGSKIDLENLLAIQALFGGDAGAGFAGHDLDVTIAADAFEGFGLEAQGVSAKFRLTNGSASVERLSVRDLVGARIESTGKLEDFLAKPSGQLTVKIEAADGGPLAALALQRLGDNSGLGPVLRALASDPDISGNVSLTLELEARALAEESRGTMIASGTVGGTAISLRDRFEGNLAAWRTMRHDMALSLANDSPQTLARQLSFTVSPLDPSGPLELTLDAAGKLSDEANLHFSANAPQTFLSAGGKVMLSEPAGGRGMPELDQFDLDWKLGSGDIDPWVLLAGYPFPGTGEGNALSLAFKAKGQPRDFAISAISGDYAGDPFTGDLVLRTLPAAAPKFSGTLALMNVSLPVLAELALGNGTSGGAALAEGISTVEFGSPWFTGFNGEVDVTAHHFDLGTEDGATDFKARLAFSDLGLVASSLQFEWLGATVSGNAGVANAQGNASFNAQLSAAGAPIEAMLQAIGLSALISGKADVSATLESSGRSLDAMTSAVSGSGVLHIAEGRVVGISGERLSEVLEQTDADGFDIRAETVEPIARAAFLTGSLTIPELSQPFTVTQGKVALRNLSFDSQYGPVAAQAEWDIRSGAMQTTVTVSPDPGGEALAGAVPAVAFTWSGEPGLFETTADTSQLEGYLSLRAFEREQRRVELLQEQVLEKQRLRREVILTNARIARRDQERLDELNRLEELQRMLEEERARKAAEDAEKAKAEEEARLKAEPLEKLDGQESAPLRQRSGVPQTRPGTTGSTQSGGASSSGLFDNIQKKLFGN